MFEKLMGKGYKYYRFLYTVFAFTWLVIIIVYQMSITTLYLLKPVLLIQIGGAIISAVGLFIMIICIIKYFMQLSGVSWLTSKQHESKLMVDTIHHLVRHPLYFGTFLFIWGLPLIFPILSLLVANVIITIYTLIGIKFEEKKLILEFGEGYLKYQQTVPMIIPHFFTRGSYCVSKSNKRTCKKDMN